MDYILFTWGQKECLLESVDGCITLYNKEVLKLMTIFIPHLAEGFATQSGAIFGFGDQAEQDTCYILKISSADDAKRCKLNQAPIHNLHEASVGWVNQELTIRSKKHLESVSQKLIINKGIDLLSNASTHNLKEFRKPAKEIEHNKMQWAEKVKQQLEKGFSEKEVVNLKKESTKYNLLEKLKKESPPGPFVTADDVSEYLKTCVAEEVKNKHLYNEVRCMDNQPDSKAFCWCLPFKKESSKFINIRIC